MNIPRLTVPTNLSVETVEKGIASPRYAVDDFRMGDGVVAGGLTSGLLAVWYGDIISGSRESIKLSCLHTLRGTVCLT